MATVADIVSQYQGNQVGSFGYVSGDMGTITVSGKVLSILVHATIAGTFTINGGDTIPVPANVGLSFSPCGNLQDATFIFNGTDMYLIELAQ